MKKQSILQRIPKKLLLVALILLLLPCFAFGASPPTTASPALKAKVPLLKTKGVKKTIAPKDLNKTIRFKGAMQILTIGFVTYADGNWVCFNTYKNIGSTIFEVGQLEFRSTTILKNGSRIFEGIRKNSIRLVPGRGHSRSLAWSRCSSASKVMVEIWYGNRRLDTKIVEVPAINVSLNRKACDQGWIKNNTNYIVKVDYRVLPKTRLTIGGGGTIHHVAIPDTTIILPANGSKSLPKITNLPDGFDIQVLFKDQKSCSGAGFVVLDSRYFWSCPPPGEQDPSDMNQLGGSPLLKTE